MQNDQQFSFTHVEHMKNLTNGAGIVEQFDVFFVEQLLGDKTKGGGGYHHGFVISYTVR